MSSTQQLVVPVELSDAARRTGLADSDAMMAAVAVARGARLGGQGGGRYVDLGAFTTGRCAVPVGGVTVLEVGVL